MGLAAFTANEDDVPVLKIRVSFLESANARIIKLFFYGDRVVSRWEESPGTAYLTEALASVRQQVALVGSLLSRIGEDLVVYRLRRAFEAEVVLREDTL